MLDKVRLSEAVGEPEPLNVKEGLTEATALPLSETEGVCEVLEVNVGEMDVLALTLSVPLVDLLSVSESVAEVVVVWEAVIEKLTVGVPDEVREAEPDAEACIDEVEE